ncbi:uncharacterized protein pmfbp1 isoform X3 [Chiloscyllium punctatum]|uniref:uncharacterized protein pmfbp1 isoform X3 n=1 Tax=Chiloscyllium punctatum TaxID=137246 RepID=UPI003B63A009
MSVSGRWEKAGEAAGESGGLGGRVRTSTQLSGTAGDLVGRFGISDGVGTVSQPEMQELLGEFRALYQERLHQLEALNDGREETLGLKVQILQSYINDLSEQNDALVQAMEELEKEANRRVTSLVEDLQTYVAKVTECKEENNILFTTKENLEKQIVEVKIKLGSSEDALLNLQEENTNLKTEIYNLRAKPEYARADELSSVALRAMPTEHLSGSTATLPPTNYNEDLMEYEEVKFHLAAKEQVIQNLQSQLREAVYLQQQSKYELWRSEEAFTQLKKDLEEVRLGPNSGLKDTYLGCTHTTLQENQTQSYRATSLLKTELERRDGTILNLRKEVLLLQEKRDGLTTELDVQERRIYHLQAELREGEAKLEQKQSCLQQLKEELDTTKKLHKDAQEQIVNLTATLQDLEQSSRNAKSVFAAEAAQKYKELVSMREELEKKVAGTQAELSEKDGTICRLRAQAEETKVQLEGVQVELKTMRTKYNLAINEVAEKAEEIQVTNSIHEALKVTAAQYEKTICELESKFRQGQSNQEHARDKMIRLERTVKQLEEERVRLQEHCNELVEENGQLHARLEVENLTVQNQQNIMAMELCRKEDLIQELKNEKIALQAKANSTAEKVNHCQATIRQLNTELSSLHIAQESVEKISEHKQQTIYQLETETQALQSKVLELQTKRLKLEEQLNSTDLESASLRANLQTKSEEVQQLREQLEKSKKTMHHMTEELSKIKANLQLELLHKEDNLEKVKKELFAVTEESNQRAVQLLNCAAEKQKQEADLTDLHEKHNAAQQEVNSRGQAVLKLKTDLKTAEENFRSAKEELAFQKTEIVHKKTEINSLLTEVQGLRDACKERDKKMSQQEQAILNLQHELKISNQQNHCQEKSMEQLQEEFDVFKQAHESDMDHFSHETARVQKELDSTTKELQERLTKLQQYKSTVDRLNSDLQHAHEQHQDVVQEVSQCEDIMRNQESEIAHLKQQQLDSENQVATAKQNCKSLETMLDLYKQKYQTCINRITELENSMQSLETDLQDANRQLCNRDETVHKLRNDMLTVQHQYETKCRQVEHCEDKVDQLTHQLQVAQESLSANKEHVTQCEEIIRSLQEQATVHHNQVIGWEESLVKRQTDFTSYKATHSHSDTDYNLQTAQLDQLKKDFAQVNVQSSEFAQEISNYQEMIHKMKAQLTTVTEQKNDGIKDVARLEKVVQGLQLDLASELQKHQMESAKLGLQITQLENDLRNSQKLYNQREQAIQKRDDLLRKSETDLLQARDSIKGKVTEIEKQGAVVKSLEMDVQRLEKEKQQKENENISLKAEIEQLNQDLQNSNKNCREFAQELAHHQEKLLLMESSLQTTQDQLSDRVTEIVRHEQANRKLQSELKILKERETSNKEEIDANRVQIEKLKAENAQNKQSHETAVTEGLKHQQSICKLEMEVNTSKEQIKMLQMQIHQKEDESNRLREELKSEQTRQEELQRQSQKLKEQVGELKRETDELNDKFKESTQLLKEKEDHILFLEDNLAQFQKKHQALLNEYRNCESELQVAQTNLSTAQKQNKYYTEEATRQEDKFANLQSELNTVQEQARKTNHELKSADQLIHELRRELTACHGTQKENMEQLSEKSREIASLRNDIARSQQRNMQLAEESAAYEERMRRLHDELKKMQALNQRAEEEAHICENRLVELSNQMIMSQGKSHETMKELSSKEEELLIMKVELVSLREKYHSKTEELETLRKSLHGARSDSSRLHRESELVVANVNQWVKDQKQANEKLGNKIKEQTKQILQLTTEKDHLQEMNERLQHENKKLKVEVDEKRIANERLKALHSHPGEHSNVARQFRSPFQDEDYNSLRSMRRTFSSTGNLRKLKPLAANWNFD